MKIGKTVTTVTSPQRRVRKAGEKPVPWKEDEKPIPVKIPKKKTEKVPA